jgi:hypothetical protein
VEVEDTNWVVTGGYYIHAHLLVSSASFRISESLATSSQIMYSLSTSIFFQIAARAREPEIEKGWPD